MQPWVSLKHLMTLLGKNLRNSIHNLGIIFNIFRDVETPKTLGKMVSDGASKGTRLQKSLAQMFCF